MVRMSEGLTATQQVKKRKQYKKWVNWAVGLGTVSLFIMTAVWMVIEEPVVLFVGLGLYWLGCLGMAVGYWYSPVSVRDELEQQMEREASQTTIIFVIAVTTIGLPAEVVLSTTGVYTAPAAVQGVIWGYMLLILIFLAAHWIRKRQYK